MNKIIILTIIFLTQFSYGQVSSRDGEYLLERKKYIDIIKNLEPIYQGKPEQKIALQLADAFLHIRKYEKAMIYYEMAINTAPINEKATEDYFSALYEYGDMETAHTVALDFASKYGKGKLKAKMDSLEYFKKLDPTYFEYNLKSNTEDNEYGMYPFLGNKKIINSNIAMKSYDYYTTTTSNIKTYAPYVVTYSDKEGGSFSEYVPLTTKNDKYYDVVSHYDETERKVYITRSDLSKTTNIKKISNLSNLKIFTATIDDNFKLINFEEFPYNSDQYSVGHACVSKDGEILYFVSDKPGGYGGTDIYRCMKLEDGTWGFPINLGNNVNTAGDEMYPYISPQGTALYFSSTGHSIFGGLDINKSYKTRSHTFLKPENVGLPFNSNKDDFGIIFNDNYGTEGFFSSNRLQDGHGGDDIFYFSYQNNKVCKDPVKNFKMLVVDKKTKEPLANVALKMTVKADGRVYEDVTDNNGEVNLTVEGCNDFDVEATRDFYLNNLFYYDGFRKSVTIELDKKELNNMVELESIFYEKAKYDVPPASIKQLTLLATLLKKNTDVKIELSSHTDSRGEDKFNMELSQKRAEAIVRFLVSNGVNPAQMVAQGYGESQLVNACTNGVECTEDLHEKNRRTIFKIIEIAKQKFPGSSSTGTKTNVSVPSTTTEVKQPKTNSSSNHSIEE